MFKQTLNRSARRATTQCQFCKVTIIYPPLCSPTQPQPPKPGCSLAENSSFLPVFMCAENIQLSCLKLDFVFWLLVMIPTNDSHPTPPPPKAPPLMWNKHRHCLRARCQSETSAHDITERKARLVSIFFVIKSKPQSPSRTLQKRALLRTCLEGF